MPNSIKNLNRIAVVLRYTQGIALCLCVLSGALVLKAAGEFESADGWVEHSHEVLATINGIRLDTLRAGFWLRNLEIFPTERADPEIRGACARALQGVRHLQQLTVDNPPQQARAGVIDREVRKTVGWIQDAADIGEADGSKPLGRVLAMRIRIDSARVLRAALSDIEAEENRLLRTRFQSQTERLKALKMLASGSGLTFLAFLAWSFVYSGRLLKRSQGQIQDLAAESRLDPLTGLLNRRGLFRQIDTLQADSPLSVLALDLDDFKPINDRFGHEAGDEVLKTVASRLQEQCRDGDLVCRLGGDEFLVVLRGIEDRTRAEIIAARIRLALRQPMTTGGSEIRVGTSIGIAVRGVDALDFTDLMKLADADSYSSKHESKRTSDPQALAGSRAGNSAEEPSQPTLVC